MVVGVVAVVGDPTLFSQTRLGGLSVLCSDVYRLDNKKGKIQVIIVSTTKSKAHGNESIKMLKNPHSGLGYSGYSERGVLRSRIAWSPSLCRGEMAKAKWVGGKTGDSAIKLEFTANQRTNS